MTGTDPLAAARAELARFHERRRERATSARGYLALTNTQWVDAEQPIWGVPGRWGPAAIAGSGLTLTASADLGIVVDGVPVDGSVTVFGDDAISPSLVQFADGSSATVIANDDHSAFALRVWNTASEGNQRFGSISSYDYDPDWVIRADFVPNPDGASIDIVHQKDHGRPRPLPLPGLIRFRRDGADYELAAFPSGNPDDSLQLVFADATNGVTTYSVGRFLFVTPADDGSIELDFNRAVLPPCAFSYHFNCPIPPAQNRLSLAVAAGEQQVLAADGTPLHE